MSNPLDQPHVHLLNSSSLTSVPQMHVVKITPHLQCAIPDLSLSAVDPTTTMISSDTVISNPIVLDGSLSNVDHITSLERTVWSNFFCCGFQLPDFHALLEHFEENHVVVLAPNGKRIYPREGLRSVPLDPTSSIVPSPSSSRASSVTPGYPPPSPQNSSSNVLASKNCSLANRKSSLAVPPVYTPFTPSLPVDPAYPFPDAAEIVLDQDVDFDFSVHPDYFPPVTPEPSSSSEDEDMSDAFTANSGGITSPSSPIITRACEFDSEDISKQVRFVNPKRQDIGRVISSWKSNKSKRHQGFSPSHSKRREKTYGCPTKGCIKSYLNPNGLKYHLEKGTCKFSDDDDGCASAPTLRQKSQVPPDTSVDTPMLPLTPDQPEESPVKPSCETTSADDPAPNLIQVQIPPPSESQVIPNDGDDDDSTEESKSNEDTLHLVNANAAPSAATPDFQQQQQDSVQSPPDKKESNPSHSPLLQCHYPVPTYPQGYIYAPQHKAYYAVDVVAFASTPSHVLASFGNDAGVASS